MEFCGNCGRPIVVEDEDPFLKWVDHVREQEGLAPVPDDRALRLERMLAEGLCARCYGGQQQAMTHWRVTRKLLS